YVKRVLHLLGDAVDRVGERVPAIDRQLGHEKARVLGSDLLPGDEVDHLVHDFFRWRRRQLAAVITVCGERLQGPCSNRRLLCLGDTTLRVAERREEISRRTDVAT